MNAAVAKKWVAALRSGKYQQGRGALRRLDNTYCCLGVLCEIDGRYVAEEPQPQLNYDKAPMTYANCAVYPPNPIWEDAGLRWDGMNKLARINDASDSTFAEIADYIEANVENL